MGNYIPRHFLCIRNRLRSFLYNIFDFLKLRSPMGSNKAQTRIPNVLDIYTIRYSVREYAYRSFTFFFEKFTT